ncbi:MAG TPA: hypothetical protein VMG38_14050 [Trebonia sp.]|nr:hypothetical protein [Trebonia sp.]
MLTLLAGICGCSVGAASAGFDAVSQSPITPIVLKVTKAGLIGLEDSGIPGGDLIGPLGTWGVGLLQDHIAKEHSQNPDATLLIVTHTVHGKRLGTIYRINTDRTLQVVLNGKFVEEITPGVITITARPGTNSKIVVTDANAGEHIYRKGSDTFWRKGYSVDLDNGRTGSVTIGGAEISQGYVGDVSAVNGTTALLWPGPGQPSLGACMSFPASQWGTSLSGPRLGSIPAGTTWCVHTTHGYYGAIVTQSDGLEGFRFTYVLWAKH